MWGRLDTAVRGLIPLTSVVALQLYSAPVMAQDSATATPRAAVQAFLAAAQTGDGARLAALVHPEILAAFKEQQLGVLTSWAEATGGRGRGTQGMMGFSVKPATPELLRKYGHTPVSGVEGVRTLADFVGLPPAQFFARTVEANGRVYEGRATGDGPPPIIGEVAESDSVVYVLYRSRFVAQDNPLVPKAAVMAVRRYEGRWLVTPDFMELGRLGSLMSLTQSLAPDR